MLGQLTLNEIEKIASKPAVRRIAVENFLATMGQREGDAYCNLYLDASLYHWNQPTVNAILRGIALAKRKEVIVK